MKRKAIISTPAILLPVLFFLLSASGCTSVLVRPLMDPLTLSMQKQTDLELLQEGAPSLLLLLDGLLADDPDNEQLLMAATRAYGAYAAILHENGETERGARTSTRAKEYGIRLLKQVPGLKEISSGSLVEIEPVLDTVSASRTGHLFWGGYGWATWIQFQSGAPAAMADLSTVEKIMLRVVELDESYYYGGAHVFLGFYYGSRPAMFGGRPDVSREHFEKALQLSNRKFLLTQVAYAETYARMVFDRDLFVKLLQEVLAQPLDDSDMAASNKLAKVKAEKLMAQADEFF